MNKVALPESDSFHLLGLLFTNNLSWNEHIEQTSKPTSKKIGSLYRASECLTEDTEALSPAVISGLALQLLLLTL